MIRLLLLGILRRCAAMPTHRQSRPATAVDFTGVFQMLPLPTSATQVLRKIRGLPLPFFAHYSGGYWLHEQQTQLQRNRKPAHARTLHTETSRLFRRPLREADKGRLLRDRPSDYKIQELWKVDRINAPANVDNVNLNEGDIIMQMLDRSGKQII
jgi:hypothetical protein